MKSMFIKAAKWCVFAASFTSFVVKADTENTSEKSHERVVLTAQQRSNAGIKTTKLYSGLQKQVFTIQGEVKSNQYETQLVTPLTDSIILKRYVTKSAFVEQGQPLATLFSAEVANKQTAFVDAFMKLQRIKNIDKKLITEQEKQLAELHYSSAKATLVGLGLDNLQIEQLETSQIAAFGQYTLNAPREGVIVKDDFVLGQRVEPGFKLFTISNEKALWVEAQLPWQYDQSFPTNLIANVRYGDNQFTAQLLSQSHYVDERSRAMALRFSVDNHAEQLHPGMFVSLDVPSTETLSFVVPKDAVVRSPDGDFQLYIEAEPNQFEPIEIAVIGPAIKGLLVSDIPDGANVVTEGVHFLTSEASKSGFDAHGH